MLGRVTVSKLTNDSCEYAERELFVRRSCDSWLSVSASRPSSSAPPGRNADGGGAGPCSVALTAGPAGSPSAGTNSAGVPGDAGDTCTRGTGIASAGSA